MLSTPNADVEVFNLKAIAGELDWAIAQTNFASLPDRDGFRAKDLRNVPTGFPVSTPTGRAT